MPIWLIFIIIYTLGKSLREGAKKKALSISSVSESLFFYSLVCLICVIPFSGNIFALSALQIAKVFLKSLVIFFAWICAFSGIKKMPVGLYGVLDMARMVCSILLAVILLNESLSRNQLVGIVFIAAGLCLVNTHKRNDNPEPVTFVAILMVLASCLLNAFSGILDKTLTSEMETGPMQFWYMFFLVLLYGGYLLYKEKKISFGALKRNPWLIVLGVLLAGGDRLLFYANADPESKVAVMSAIKQSSVITTLILGKIAFQEKRFWYKIACASLIVAGAVITLLEVDFLSLFGI